MKTILVVGAGSRVSREFAKIVATHGFTVLISGRDGAETEITARDIQLRSNSKQVYPVRLDLSCPNDFDSFIAKHVPEEGLFGVMISAGIMPPEAELTIESSLFSKMATANYVGIAQFIDKLVPLMPPGRTSFISCVTSVAGDRGRASNFRYGSTKAGLSTFLEGLGATQKNGLLVQDVKLGPVNTPMNSGLSRTPFMISPRRAAEKIWRGILKRTHKLYVPGKWWWIMLVIRLIPPSLFRKLPL